MKKTLSYIFTIALFALGFSSCTCEDIGWKPQEPISQIQGLVLVGGQVGAKPSPVANAVIEVVVNGNKYTTTTNNNGYYLIDKIEPGSAIAEVSVKESGIHGYSKHVTIENNSIATCNFVLVKASTEVVHEKVGDDDIYSINLPDVIQKDKEVVQIASYYVPDGTLREGEELELEAWYELRPNIYQTRASVIPLVDKEGFGYMGENIDITVSANSSLGNEESLKPFEIEVKDLMTPVCVVHNGTEVEVSRDTEKKVSTFMTDEIGKTVLTYPIYSKDLGEGTEAIVFSPAEYFSNGGTTNISSSYLWKHVEYNWEELTPSILWQYAIIMTGFPENAENNIYSATVDIPKGETIVLEGKQHYHLTRFKCGWAYVDAKIYDQVQIQYKDRKHTGGSN